MCRNHEDHITAIKERVWDNPTFKKLPYYYQTALHEVEHGLFHDIQMNWVVWMHLDSKGKQVFYEDLNEQERIEYAKADKTGKHYWLKLDHVQGKTIVCDLATMTATRKYKITNKEW